MEHFTWNSGNFGMLFFGSDNEGASRICKLQTYWYGWGEGSKTGATYTKFHPHKFQIPTFLFNGRALNLRAAGFTSSSSVLFLGLKYENCHLCPAACLDKRPFYLWKYEKIATRANLILWALLAVSSSGSLGIVIFILPWAEFLSTVSSCKTTLKCSMFLSPFQ